MQRHLDVATSHWNPVVSIAEATVVEGSVMVLDSNDVPQVIARPVAMSVIWMMSI
jgi:hypothetical protein